MKYLRVDGVKIKPTKIVCVGRNYVEHIKELNNEMPSEPVIFVKPNSSITNRIETSKTEEIHYEAEMCFSMKNGHIYAVGFGLDLTKRKVQAMLKSKGLPWERAKSFDKSAVFSDFVQCKAEQQDYKMELFINDTLQQVGSYELMINKPNALVDNINEFMTLVDDDIIMTGTPKGVGVIHAGDRFKARILEGEAVIIEAAWIAQ